MQLAETTYTKLIIYDQIFQKHKKKYNTTITSSTSETQNRKLYQKTKITPTIKYVLHNNTTFPTASSPYSTTNNIQINKKKITTKNITNPKVITATDNNKEKYNYEPSDNRNTRISSPTTSNTKNKGNNNNRASIFNTKLI